MHILNSHYSGDTTKTSQGSQCKLNKNGFPLIGHVYSVGTCLGLKGVLWKEDSLYRVFKSSFLFFFVLILRFQKIPFVIFE